ncbi:MAG TPA: Asp23/Gls24 family envelope stress response protein [Gaiellaceae bacterium]|nr:Asp23/Gls24 family envelope stress response protein [Gaiellaceae bacterium]
MSRDGHTIEAAGGTIRIEGDALSGLVVTAAELIDGARVRRPRRGLDVSVQDGRARVSLELVARYGAVLPELGTAVQVSVAAALRDSAGLEPEAVDVAVEGLEL